MLELLVKYARDHGLEAEPGFKPKDVRWAVVCDAAGQFLDVIELGDPDRKRNPGQTFQKCPDLTQSEMVSGGETKSHFLTDTAEVVMLYGKRSDDQKVIAKHEYFTSLLRAASDAMPQLMRLAELLADGITVDSVKSRLEKKRAKPADKLTFKLGDSFPLDSNLWHDWWRDFRKRLSGEETNEKSGAKALAEKPAMRQKEPETLMRCFVTGELVEPVKTHLKVERLSDVGGLPTGDVLVGFDKDSFRSYGLKQAANAAVSEEASAAYRAALNSLIKEHGQRLAGTKVIHWFKNKIVKEDDPLAWLEESVGQVELHAQQRAKELLQSIRSGKRSDLVENYFYALTLSGASGRIMVRDWMEGQFEQLVENVAIWFDDLAIVHREGGRLSPSPKFLAVLGATVRQLDDLATPLVAKMWRVAVRQESIPQCVLAQTLARTKVDIIQDEPPNHARMGLIRAYHLRRNRGEGGKPMTQDLGPYLNEEHPHPAYQCGRLMAVLAELQRSALGDVGAGIVQRYYAAASSTPALVLGRLTRTSQFHLNKLQPGLANSYESKIGGIWSHLRDNLPSALNLEEQSLFALGYYQQMADMRTKKSENTNQKTEEVHE